MPLTRPLFFIAASLLLQGCMSKVDIPDMHVGIVAHGRTVTDEILKPGEHYINFRSDVIVVDVRKATLPMEFDILFVDSSRGDVTMSIVFEPIADSVAHFFRKYETKHISDVLLQNSRATVRRLMLKYKPTELTKEEFKQAIIKTIKEKSELLNYVTLHSIEIIELKF